MCLGLDVFPELILYDSVELSTIDKGTQKMGRKQIWKIREEGVGYTSKAGILCSAYNKGIK